MKKQRDTDSLIVRGGRLASRLCSSLPLLATLQSALYIGSIEAMELAHTGYHPHMQPADRRRMTYQEYEKLPEGADFQLIDGEIVMTPSPGSVHQEVQARLGFLLHQYCQTMGWGKLFYAPMDVYFTEHDTFQPDILLISRGRLEIIKEKRIEGAPDFVVEILSPGTGFYDLTLKRKIYESFGVREYWIVDPMAKTVEILGNGENGFVMAGKAQGTGKVSSGLLQGLSIDITKLFEGI